MVARSGTGIALLLISFQVSSFGEVAAQRVHLPAPDAEQSPGPNHLSIALGFLGASISYSTQRTPRAALGLAVGGVAQQGFMFPAGEVTGEGGVPWFAELLGGSAFLRHQIGSRTEIEGGPRVAWLYHFPSEYETIFAGVSVDLRYRVGRVRLGPRVYWGRIGEEAGRSQTVLAVAPLIATLRWSW
jgi:hypothetical protein